MKINFIISYQKDADILMALINEPYAGDDFINLIFKKHPKLLRITKNKKVFNKTEKENIKNFVKNKYNSEKEIIKKSVQEIEKEWKKNEKAFFKLSLNIFKNYNLPKCAYTAYPSIWPLYERNFQDKIITFPYERKKYALFVIAHELLHVIFYDYIYKKYKKELKGKIENKKVWNFSEVINVIIQNQKEWLNIFDIKSKPYPQHENLYYIMDKLWQKEKKIDFLIDKILLP